MPEEYTTRPLTPEEHAILSKEIMEVLEKHNAEIGVETKIVLTKRETVEDGVKSPFQIAEEANATPEEGSESNSKESA